MPLEPSVTYISDLNPLWPTSGDAKSFGDDHIREIKYSLVTTFPNVKGVVPIAHDQFASKDYVNQTAFNTVLPGQPGGPLSYELISQNGASSWKRSDIYNDAERVAQVCALSLALS